MRAEIVAVRRFCAPLVQDKFQYCSVTVCRLVCSCKLLSAWITVAITVERLIAVVQPLKVATLSTTRRARLVIVSLTLLCLVLATFPLWTVGSEPYQGLPTCVRLEDSSYKSWLIGVVVVMTLTLPCSVLIVCTVVIVFFLSRSQHFRAEASLSGTLAYFLLRSVVVFDDQRLRGDTTGKLYISICSETDRSVYLV